MATKKTPAKKPVAAKVVKKSTAKKPAAKKSSQAKMRSFRVYPNSQPFVIFRISRQTIYWLVLLAFVIFIQVWIVKIQFDIIDLSNQITANNMN